MTCSPNADLKEMLGRAKNGDDEALTRLVDSYMNYLSLLARMQVGHTLQAKVDPADLVQETVLQVHRDIGHFLGSTEREFSAWLRSIMAHVGANVIRRFHAGCRDLRLERQLQDDVDRSSQMIGNVIQAPDTSPSQKAVRREQSVLLAQALSRLSADYREVIILHHLEAIPLADVAKKMGRSVGSVRKLWARGLVRLRDEMRGHHE